MEKEISQEEFEKQKYDEIMDKLTSLFLELFRTMLEYKNVSYVDGENDFEYLDSLVRINYPQFSQTLIELSVSRNEPYHTYLDVINTALYTYVLLKDKYNDDELEKKYFEHNPNDGKDIIDIE